MEGRLNVSPQRLIQPHSKNNSNSNSKFFYFTMGKLITVSIGELYKHLLALQGRPLIGERWHRGGQGGQLFTSSGPLVAIRGARIRTHSNYLRIFCRVGRHSSGPGDASHARCDHVKTRHE